MPEPTDLVEVTQNASLLPSSLRRTPVRLASPPQRELLLLPPHHPPPQTARHQVSLPRQNRAVPPAYRRGSSLRALRCRAAPLPHRLQRPRRRTRRSPPLQPPGPHPVPAARAQPRRTLRTAANPRAPGVHSPVLDEAHGLLAPITEMPPDPPTAESQQPTADPQKPTAPPTAEAAILPQTAVILSEARSRAVEGPDTLHTAPETYTIPALRLRGWRRPKAP
jgi:hypothetical protein